MVAQLPVVLMSLALSASPKCPDTGATTFFDGGKGYRGFRLLGADSYRTFFVGKSFRKAEGHPATAPGRVMFWLDRLMVQWQLVDASAFKAAPTASEADKLKAHFDYEYGYMKSLADQGKVKTANLQVFNPIEEKGPDGKKRVFKIWHATMGEKLDATQFWVTTSHPLGVVMLMIIAGSPDEVNSAKAVIDSYMGNYSSVDQATCQRLQDETTKSRNI
jgi:hypothetical protein